ncbi:hypothetical protein [Phenylobacterium sp.]|uniref:hypothetical protein n=1 Tax=Phenylobacterium sp. TaxID=1871053 RepID=UPI002732E04E|nr:hypothetical protein [Phenylobacterium sp.]MDP3852888.1 hypothetical protein [Phenylobacterium sp.]
MNSDEKKAALKEGVNRDLMPVIASLGFKRDRRSKEERGPYRLGTANYYRQRGEVTDDIWVHWAKYNSPRFMIEFWTDDPERLWNAYPEEIWPDGTRLGRIHPRPTTGRFGGSHRWYGSWMSVENAVRIAMARVIELDLFLRTGRPVTYVRWQGSATGEPLPKPRPRWVPLTPPADMSVPSSP